MEQVFKTKRARRWWIIIVSLVVLIIFSECVFGAKLGFFGAWGNYYFCINVLFAIENHLYCKRQWCSGN